MVEPGQNEASAVGSVLRTSVARLYSDLVTRPTGRAVRMAIERKLAEVEGASLAILDLSEVGVLDFSCADEIIAKLLLRHRARDAFGDAFFLAHGVQDHHRDPIESVLVRHRLLLVTVDRGGRKDLWGPAPTRLRRAWRSLDEMGRTAPKAYAVACGLTPATARSWLRRLVEGRVAFRDGEGGVCSLCAMLESGSCTSG